MSAGVAAWVAGHARARPGAPYLTAVGAHDARTVTYGELDALTRRTAAWAASRLGAAPGRPVAIAPRNDLDSVLLLLGAVRTGAPVLVLSPFDPERRRREQAAALGVDASATAAEPPRADALAEPPAPWRGGAPALDDDLFLVGTSGSTAASKLVAQTHRMAVANARAVGAHHGLRPGVRLLGCLPVHHVNGLHLTLLATLAAGGHAILAEGFDPLRYPALLDRFRPRLASVAPSLLEALAAVWRRPPLAGDFAYFVSAAAPLRASTARTVRERLGARVLQGYGLTETTNFSTTMPRGLDEATWRALATEEIPSVGVALPGNEVAVLTAAGERAVPGEVGEVCMRGDSVMRRYAGNPEATAQALRGGWFHSQDQGFVVERDGQVFLVLTGRTKNVAKVRGETVSLDEMDRALCALPGVRDAACVALPDRFLGERIVAAVVAERPPDVRAALAEVFAAGVLPREVLALDAIPRTATGKLRRRELADAVAARLGAERALHPDPAPDAVAQDVAAGAEPEHPQ